MHARSEWRGVLAGLCLAAATLFPWVARAAQPAAPAACALNRHVAGAHTLKGWNWAYERQLGMLLLRDATGNAGACLSYVPSSAG